jgi:hypothetical protein
MLQEGSGYLHNIAECAGLQIEGVFYAFKMPKTHWG